jgi:hypothetical protein
MRVLDKALGLVPTIVRETSYRFALLSADQSQCICVVIAVFMEAISSKIKVRGLEEQPKLFRVFED